MDPSKMSPPDMLKKNPETRQLAVAAACFLAQGLRPVEIGEKIGRSESYVSRLLSAAKDWGFLSRAPIVLRHNISNEDWEATQTRFFQDETMTPLLKFLVPEPNHFFQAFQLPGDYDEFLRAAAGHVGRAVRHSQLIGANWGRTIYKLVRYLEVLSNTLDRDRLRRIECIPLCGDPTYLMNQRRLEYSYSASWLATTFEEALTGRSRPTFPWLGGVPAYVRRAMRATSAGSRANAHGFDDEMPGYQAIFGRGRRLIDRVDTVITGAGIVVLGEETLEHSTGDLLEERIQQETDLTKAKLDQIVFGDIGGWLIEKPGLSLEDQELVEDLNRGWTGATQEHIKWIAAAAVPSQRAGVILVARGAAKASLIIEAVRRGLVNTLLIDEELGECIKTILREPDRQGQTSGR